MNKFKEPNKIKSLEKNLDAYIKYVEKFLYDNRNKLKLDTSWIKEGINYKAAYPAMWINIGHKHNRPICNNRGKFNSLDKVGQLSCGAVIIGKNNDAGDGQHTTDWFRGKGGEVKDLIVQFDRSFKYEYIACIQSGKDWTFEDVVKYGNANKDMNTVYKISQKTGISLGTLADSLGISTQKTNKEEWKLGQFKLSRIKLNSFNRIYPKIIPLIRSAITPFTGKDTSTLAAAAIKAMIDKVKVTKQGKNAKPRLTITEFKIAIESAKAVSLSRNDERIKTSTLKNIIDEMTSSKTKVTEITSDELLGKEVKVEHKYARS